MKKRLSRYAEALVAVTVLLAFAWGWMWIDGNHASIPFVSPAQPNIAATSTTEFDLSGIDNQDKLVDRIEIIIAETRAEQQKKQAEQRLNELQRKKTSLK